jgi:trk system potassium uptake protein TrkA
MAKKQVIVAGLGRFGASMAGTLYQMGHDVLALDTDPRRVQDVMGQVTHPVAADATNEATLRELGVSNFDVAVVAIGSNVEANIMAAVLFKSIGIPFLVARARNPLHAQTLERIGADIVVQPELERGTRIARSLFNPDVLEYMELAPSFGISKVRVPDEMCNKTLKDAGLSTARDKYGLAVLGVRRGKDLILLPAEEERLRAGDLLVIASSDDLLEKLRADHSL